MSFLPKHPVEMSLLRISLIVVFTTEISDGEQIALADMNSSPFVVWCISIYPSLLVIPGIPKSVVNSTTIV
jgi:hypothetical protein